MESQPQSQASAPKFEERAGRWKFPDGIEFASAAVEDSYQRRAQMFIDVISLKKPERVPVCPAMGFYPFVYAGVSRFTGRACFGGNLPSSLLIAGKPEEIKVHVMRLIDDVGQDGGYILSTGATVDNAVAANLHAMIDTCKEYGVYR